MKGKLLLSLLKDTWLILPAFAMAQQSFINQMLQGQDVSFNTQNGDQPPEIVTFHTRQGKVNSNGNQQSVAIINLTGPIVKYDGACGEPGAMSVAREIKAMDNNPQVAGIVLNIDSPGGASTGATLLAEAIKQCNKPIVASIAHGYAASAAYWAASQCDEIYLAHVTDQVGSIGAYCTLVDDTEAMAQRGYKVKTIYAPESSDKNGDYRAAIEQDDTSAIEQELSTLVQHFITDIKSARGERIKTDSAFTGKMYQLNDAMAIGLIDGQKDMQGAINRVYELANNKTSSQTKSSKQANHMPNSKLLIPTLAIALGWADGFEATEQGISLTTDEANDLNAHLEDLATQVQTNADAATQLATAQERITALEAELNTAKTEAKTYKDLAKEFGAKPAGKGTQLNTDTDPSPGTKDEPKKVDSVTAEAMRIFNMRKK